MKTWILVLTAASYGCSSSASSTETSPSATADAGVSAIADAGVSATVDAAPADAASATADAGSTTADAGGSNARSAPSEGGTSGTVDSVSTPTFVITTAAGQKVTVNETPSTVYWNGASSISANAITTGETVLVLGIVSSTSIAATEVTVEPNDGGGSAASAAAGVVPFQPGAPSAAKEVGQIPASYTEGQGTIVSGATADQATEAALAAYPGVLVDRVVELSTGEYEVHCISVNWPHHIFVATDFTVVGAN